MNYHHKFVCVSAGHVSEMRMKVCMHKYMHKQVLMIVVMMMMKMMMVIIIIMKLLIMMTKRKSFLQPEVSTYECLRCLGALNEIYNIYLLHAKHF